ncbi:MAG: hypothetical protein ABSC94_04300 [Polyangiaceae bacterium]|jgi:hypothetical protein
MARTLTTTIGATIGLLLTTSLSEADTRHDFGSPGELIISADRLVPFFSYTRVAQDDYGATPGVASSSTTSTETSLSFFYGSSHGSLTTLTQEEEDQFFTVPRIGVDYVLAPNVTVGGDLILFFSGASQSNQTDYTNGTTENVSQSVGGSTVFGLAPRAGYILRVNGLVSLWLRGGLSFYTSVAGTARQPDGSYAHEDVDELALDLDPQIVITPMPHFGLTAGLTADIPLVGQHSLTQFNADGSEASEESASSSVMFLGVTVGLLGYF